MDLTEILSLLNGSNPAGWVLAIVMIGYQIYIRSQKKPVPAPTPAPAQEAPKVEALPFPIGPRAGFPILTMIWYMLEELLKKKANGQPLTQEESDLIEKAQKRFGPIDSNPQTR